MLVMRGRHDESFDKRGQCRVLRWRAVRASGEKKSENHLARDTIGLASLTAVCGRWSALERLVAPVTLSNVMWW